MQSINYLSTSGVADPPRRQEDGVVEPAEGAGKNPSDVTSEFAIASSVL